MKRLVVSAAGWIRTKPLLGSIALRLLPDIPRTFQLPGIGPFRLRLRRNRSFWLRDPIFSEGVPLGYLREITRPGDVYYDVGANLGLYARVLSDLFQAGTVLAFEPMSDNVKLLRQNIALAKDPSKIRLMEIALSDRDGEELLQVDDMMTSSATLDRVTGGRPAIGREQYGLSARTETVRVARLDTLIEREKLPPPNVMKIDIEGAELMMLRGATHTLARHRPLLLIEMHGLDITRSVLELLEQAGYHVWAELPDFPATGRRAYRQIHASDVDGRTNVYDIQHILASTDPSRIDHPIAPYTC
jgi:FkbM family methyltransferase